MMRIQQKKFSDLYYVDCPYCFAELGFWLTNPPVYCRKCLALLPINPASLVEFVETRKVHYKEGIDLEDVETVECL